MYEADSVGHRPASCTSSPRYPIRLTKYHYASLSRFSHERCVKKHWSMDFANIFLINLLLIPLFSPFGRLPKLQLLSLTLFPSYLDRRASSNQLLRLSQSRVLRHVSRRWILISCSLTRALKPSTSFTSSRWPVFTPRASTSCVTVCLMVCFSSRS